MFFWKNKTNTTPPEKDGSEMNTIIDALKREHILDLAQQMSCKRAQSAGKQTMQILRETIKAKESWERIYALFKQKYGYTYIEHQALISKITQNLEHSKKLPKSISERAQAVVFSYNGSEYGVGFVDPWIKIENQSVVDIIKSNLNTMVSVHIIDPIAYADAISYIQNQTTKPRDPKPTQPATSQPFGNPFAKNQPANPGKPNPEPADTIDRTSEHTRNQKILALLQNHLPLNPKDIEKSMDVQKENGGKLEDILIAERIVPNSQELYKAMAKALNVAYINSFRDLKSMASDVLTAEKALEIQALAFHPTPERISVLFCDPTITQEIENTFNQKKVDLHLCTPQFWSEVYTTTYTSNRKLPIEQTIMLKGNLTREQLNQISIKEPEMDLVDACLKHKLINEVQAAEAIAMVNGVRYIDPLTHPPDLSIKSTINRVTAESNIIFPYQLKDEKNLVVLMARVDWQVIDRIRQSTHKEIHYMIATETAIKQLIDQAYIKTEDRKKIERDFKNISQPTSGKITTFANDDSSVSRYIQTMIDSAVRENASDIHIEPLKDSCRIRMRIDGELTQYDSFEAQAGPPLISGIKLKADMDIAERRVPQDGRINLANISLRVSSVPGVNGEKVVMRILKKGSDVPKLEQLGIHRNIDRQFRKVINQPQGLILVTGPTGSGKTTTCSAVIQSINTEGKNIVSAEDPVEYEIPGINQNPVNVAAGATFPILLRAFLRQDPDVIFVGEIRDAETAKIATEAASTGHLVIATMHTNNAVATIQRLRDFGIKDYAIADYLRGVMAQRLVRKVCSECGQYHEPHPEKLTDLKVVESLEDYERKLKTMGWTAQQAVMNGLVQEPELFDEKAFNFRTGTGEINGVTCRECRGSGYKGRAAIHEMLVVDENIKRAINDHKSIDEITQLAIKQGFTSLRQDGIIKARMGLTTIDEVIRASSDE